MSAMPAVENKMRRCLTFIWKIENAGLLEVADPFWSIESPVFSPRSLGGRRFRLYLNLNREDEDEEFLMFLFFQKDEPLDFPKDYQWSFIDCNETPIFGGTVQNHVLHVNERIEMPGCPTFEEVFVTRKSEFLLNDTLTLRCRIWKSGGELSQDEFILCRSRYELVEDSFLWPISEFGSLELNQEVTTPVKFEFSCGSCEFQLKFALKDASPDDDASANLELVADAISWDVKVVLKVSFLDNEQNVLKSTENAKEYFDKDSKESWVLPLTIPKKELQGRISDSLSDDSLNLFCEFTATLIKCSHSFDKKYCGFSNFAKESSNENSLSV